MSELSDELARVAGAIQAQRAMPLVYGRLSLDAAGWAEFDKLGLTALPAPETAGGSGGDLRDAAAVVGAAPTSATPLADANFVAAPFVGWAGLQWPAGVVTAAPPAQVTLSGSEGEVRLSGELTGVPWLRNAEAAVVIVDDPADPVVVILSPTADGVTLREGYNVAGEERDDAVLDRVRPVTLAHLPTGAAPFSSQQLGALARSVQLAGAASQVLTLVRRHVADRHQFGRPLIAFQAVQQSVAILATEVTAMRAAADAAVAAVAVGSPSAPLLVAAAKIRTSTGAQGVAATAHQLHGAIGITREHTLATCTERLWAWREEYGNELWWQDHLADLLYDKAGGHMWELLTGLTADGMVRT